MSVRLKVYGGTPGEDLCQRCSNFREIRGHRESDCIRRCEGTEPASALTFPVASCSYFKEKDNLCREGAARLRFDPGTDRLLITIGGLFRYEMPIADYLKSVDERKAGKAAPEQPIPEVVQ